MTLFTDVKWAMGWNAKGVREWLGDDWKPTGNRRYPGRVVGFKSPSGWVSEDELNKRLYYGGLVHRKWATYGPVPCSDTAVHAALNPASFFSQGRSSIYLILMLAAGSHNSDNQWSHKWYGTEYRVVARMSRTNALHRYDWYGYYSNGSLSLSRLRVQALEELEVIT